MDDALETQAVIEKAHEPSPPQSRAASPAPDVESAAAPASPAVSVSSAPTLHRASSSGASDGGASFDGPSGASPAASPRAAGAAARAPVLRRADSGSESDDGSGSESDGSRPASPLLRRASSGSDTDDDGPRPLLRRDSSGSGSDDDPSRPPVPASAPSADAAGAGAAGAGAAPAGGAAAAAPLGRGHAVQVLAGYPKGSVGQVAHGPVNALHRVANEAAAGNIGGHYQNDVPDQLAKPATPENLREMANNETEWWKKQPGVPGKVGGAVPAGVRYGVLRANLALQNAKDALSGAASTAATAGASAAAAAGPPSQSSGIDDAADMQALLARSLAPSEPSSPSGSAAGPSAESASSSGSSKGGPAAPSGSAAGPSAVSASSNGSSSGGPAAPSGAPRDVAVKGYAGDRTRNLVSSMGHALIPNFTDDRDEAMALDRLNHPGDTVVSGFSNAGQAAAASTSRAASERALASTLPLRQPSAPERIAMDEAMLPADAPAQRDRMSEVQSSPAMQKQIADSAARTTVLGYGTPTLHSPDVAAHRVTNMKPDLVSDISIINSPGAAPPNKTVTTIPPGPTSGRVPGIGYHKNENYPQADDAAAAAGAAPAGSPVLVQTSQGLTSTPATQAQHSAQMASDVARGMGSSANVTYSFHGPPHLAVGPTPVQPSPSGAGSGSGAGATGSATSPSTAPQPHAGPGPGPAAGAAMAPPPLERASSSSSSDFAPKGVGGGGIVDDDSPAGPSAGVAPLGAPAAKAVPVPVPVPVPEVASPSAAVPDAGGAAPATPAATATAPSEKGEGVRPHAWMNRDWPPPW